MLKCAFNMFPQDLCIDILFISGFLNCTCKVIADYPEIPSEFTIILATGRPRQCRLAWRIGCEFGAEFMDRV